ncbi:RluA family pseudouridine synthase [Hugenholtzia roseola]|uniref:RluA family pseudouridine synthase n=1 Tax=Hugenholtzia roseola TaxID=1002 RepID=UPI00041F8D6F|nr:RluA family pseudouridine synthase [Hugenholtzia roseola]
MKTNYPFKVIYEDNHLLIVNKEAGVLSQGDKTGDESLVEYAKAFLKEKYDKQGNVFCGLVHRLDRPVSGLVVLAKTSKGLERMNALFKNRKINKVYWAVVKRKPPKKEDKLVHYLIKDTQKNVVSAFDYPQEGAQRAELRYRYIGAVNHFHLLEITPLTGRPHQIRVQLAAIGSPIRGDVKYGFPKANPDGNINLHARRTNFIHPIKQTPLICVAGLPNDYFWEEFLILDDMEVKDKALDYFYSV